MSQGLTGKDGFSLWQGDGSRARPQLPSLGVGVPAAARDKGAATGSGPRLVQLHSGRIRRRASQHLPPVGARPQQRGRGEARAIRGRAGWGTSS